MDEKAKLIDFGAMVPMGLSRFMVGTPPFTAPEVVNCQALDARADLFSLGATAYFTLTGRHAFPARNFKELRSLWRKHPRPPSYFVRDIPKDLDNIVLSLLQLDPLARPSNAAEVMEKLSAIAGLRIDEQLLVSQSFLSTPMLVGRESPLSRIRKRVSLALEKKGGTIIIEGTSGAGRSRFLDACVLEGKLASAVTLRADASDALAGDWGAVRALTVQLLDELPDFALQAVRPHVSVLGHVVPELLNRMKWAEAHPHSQSSYQGVLVWIPSHPLHSMSLPEERSSSPDEDRENIPRSDEDASLDGSMTDPRAALWGRGSSLRPPALAANGSIELETFDDPQQMRPRVHAALHNWLLQVSRHRCLMLAIDDLHKVDEPSAAFIALLAHAISKEKVVIAVTVESDASGTTAGAMKLISDAASRIKLRNIDLAHTEKLLCSIFGEVPNVKLLADRLYTVSQGNPRAVMQLAQHLIDTEVIRFQAGTWILPSQIDTSALPDSLAATFRLRIDSLSDDARDLAGTMALIPDKSLNFEQCLAISDQRQTASLIRILDELVASNILTTDGQHYSFSQSNWVTELTRDLNPERVRSFHLRLATLLEGDEKERFRIARHLLHAGQEERALDILVELTGKNRKLVEQSPRRRYEFLRSLPQGWMRTFESLISISQRLGRPKFERFLLLSHLISYNLILYASEKELREYIEMLFWDSGLGDYHALGETLEPSARLGRALEMAQQRYDERPESERVLNPIDAIKELSTTLIAIIRVSATAFDYPLVVSLPSLEPLIPLSPLLDIVERNVKATTHFLAGRIDVGLQGFRDLLTRMSQIDDIGLDDAQHQYALLSIMSAVGSTEASLGIASADAWADQIEIDPFFEVNAWRTRMLVHLRQGDTQKAEEMKKHIELLQIQNSPAQFFEGTHQYAELLVYADSDDLIRVKQTLSHIEQMATLYETYRPILHFAYGEYHRLRSDYLKALSEVEQALQLTGPGRHIVWPRAAGLKVRILDELGRFDEAENEGQRFLIDSEDANLGVNCNCIRAPLALVQARVGVHERAKENADKVIEVYLTSGITGVSLGTAYENRTRIAIVENDQQNFRTYVRHCAEQYRNGHNPALTAKYEKLIEEGRRVDLFISRVQGNIRGLSVDKSSIYQIDSDILSACQSPRERVRYALKLLVQQSHSIGGFLYTMQKEGALLSAVDGMSPIPADLDERVKEYLSKEIDDTNDVTMASDKMDSISGSTSDRSNWTGQDGQSLCPVLLGHHRRDGYVITGLAVLIRHPSEPFRFPSTAIQSISMALFDNGDVVTVYASN